MNGFFYGTIIFVIQTPTIITIGVDSKVTMGGREVAPLSAPVKIHQNRSVVFAHAGLFKDTNGKLDVIAAANAAIDAGGNLEQIVDRFEKVIYSQLVAVLQEFRTQTPSARRDLDVPLQMLFATASDGTPKLQVIHFERIKGSVKIIALRSTRLRCPGDCPDGTSTLFLGESDAASAFLNSDPSIVRRKGPESAIKEAIASQAATTPSLVSLPVRIASVDRYGIHGLNDEAIR